MDDDEKYRRLANARYPFRYRLANAVWFLAFVLFMAFWTYVGWLKLIVLWKLAHGL